MREAPADLVAFYEAEYPRLVGALSLLLADRHAAEDIAQEALLRACRRWRTVRRLDAPGAWVRRVAMNLASSHLRRRGSRRRAEARLEVRPVPPVEPDLVDARLRAALAALPPHQRAAVILHHVLDRPVAEVAATLGRPVGTVKSDLHHGRRALRHALAGDREAAHAR